MASSLLLLLVCILVCASAEAQYLPDIQQFEVENVRLILLNGSGERQGVLSGEIARKGRDGRITVSKAVLKVERGEQSIVVNSPEFIYQPDTSKFDCPQGLTVDLPNGGHLVVPKGGGEVKFTDGMQLNMKVDGEVTLRDGPENASLVTATVMNPDLEVKARIETVVENGKRGDQLRLDSFSVSGTRGGSMKLRLAHLPSLADAQNPSQAVVDVSCFGNVSLHISEEKHVARLSMLRRARMAFKDDERGFEVTSNQLDITGDYTRVPEEDGDEGPARLGGLAIDASQNVSITGNEFTGTGGALRYREFSAHREARLERDAGLQLNQGLSPDGRAAIIDMRARDYIDVLIPTGAAADSGTFDPREQRPAAISTELSEGARVMRSLDRDLEWQITGRLVRLFSFRDTTTGVDDRYSHVFDGYAEGYSPLLRLYGPLAVPSPESAEPHELHRAAVYGARAEGAMISGVATVDVYGPEVMGVMYSNAPLSDMLKVALGMKEPDRDAGGRVIRPAPRDGRLVVRTAESLHLEMATGQSGDVSLAGRGSVQLDHEPLPRDDGNLVTLTGEVIDLSLRAGGIRYARVGGGDALATIGYDLLMCANMEVNELHVGLRTTLAGPGRMIMRDATTVAYFTRELDRLPRRPGAPKSPVPDAAWLDFGASLVADISDNRRALEADVPLFKLVSGEFEHPRAGRSAVADLDELADPEVVLLYEAVGDRVYAVSARSQPDLPGVNLLSLEGNARVDSRLDGIGARARDAIELSGSERQSEDAPFSLVLRGDAEITIDDAGVFFGEYVQTGVFSYDKTWRLKSGERLEITLRPLETPGDAAGVVADVRKALSAALAQDVATGDVLALIDGAAQSLGLMIVATPRPPEPAADRPWEAYDKLRGALDHMRTARLLERAGLAHAAVERHVALRGVRRARALLSGLIDVAGSGTVHCGFRSGRTGVPPLDIVMGDALFTFDGLGQIVDVTAGGPIMLSRASYSIHGDSLRRAADGTLTLDRASVTLPDDTGVRVSGVESVALRRLEDKVGAGPDDRQPSMGTRVTGRDLRITVKLATGKQE
ncbi:MAG: hypothetical protein K8I27_09530 [Planctomycetes bacterium]|nr:hypothetical protein [Planctomycetota bacterium]